MNLIARRMCLNALLFAIVLHFSVGNVENFTGRNWAVLIAGSNGWENYRHQADLCHSYQLLKKHGVPPGNIITFMYNDIANHTENPYPGKIFNNPEKKDVYKGVVVDYEGEDITKSNFINVLLGDQEAMKGIGSGRVLKSGPGDNVFIYFTDHGAEFIVFLPNGYISYEELLSTLEKMHKNKQYENLLFYMEACHSGSMFNQLPKNINVYATTAANASHPSYSCYCNVETDLPCLGDSYSVNWMENTEKENVNKFTVKEQYEEVKNMTTLSEVCQFGDFNISKRVIGDFFGSLQPQSPDSSERNHGLQERNPCGEDDLHYLHKQLHKSEHGSAKHRELIEMINSTLVDMKHVKERMEMIARVLSPTTALYNKIVSGRYEGKREYGRCFTNVLQSLINTCFETQLEKKHIFKHTQKVMNMCSQEYLSEDKITHAVVEVCIKMDHEKVDLEDMEDCWMGPNSCNILCSAKGKQRGSCANIENKCICE